MSNNDIANFYANSQVGGELPYFVGKQYGSGWLRTLGRFALPILKRIGGVAVKTAGEVLNSNSKILPTLKNYALEEVGNLGAKAIDAIHERINRPSEMPVQIPVQEEVPKGPSMVARKRKSAFGGNSINKRRNIIQKTIFRK